MIVMTNVQNDVKSRHLVSIFKLKKVLCVNIVRYTSIYPAETDLDFGIKGPMSTAVVLAHTISRANVSSIESVVLAHTNSRSNSEALNGSCKFLQSSDLRLMGVMLVL